MDYTEEDIITKLKSEEGRALMESWDSHWEEVMKLAEGYGFIVNAFGGVATLATNEQQCEQTGYERKATMIKVSGLTEQVMGDN